MKAAKTRESASREAVGRRARSGNLKVLVVDDDREVTHILAAALEQWGYGVLQTNSGAEAVRIAREETIDAALIDVRMPEVDGFRVLQTLKENDEHLVAVMMTGYGNLEEARRAMKLGAYDYITKPFDFTVVRTVLKAGLKEGVNARVLPAGKVVSSTTLMTSDR